MAKSRRAGRKGRGKRGGLPPHVEHPEYVPAKKRIAAFESTISNQAKEILPKMKAATAKAEKLGASKVEKIGTNVMDAVKNWGKNLLADAEKPAVPHVPSMAAHDVAARNLERYKRGGKGKKSRKHKSRKHRKGTRKGMRRKTARRAYMKRHKTRKH